MSNDFVAKKNIYNCHVHTFTIDHVPKSFVPMPFGWMLRSELIRKAIVPSLRFFNRTWGCPRLIRYANFAKMSALSSQRDVFESLQSRYPRGTKFVVLPMDMAYISGQIADEGPANLNSQHQEVLSLTKEFGDQVIPFFAVDPRRPKILDELKTAYEKGFVGIKLYPNLGYSPGDERLEPIWQFADEKKLPVMTHCSRGGIHGYDDRKRKKVSENTAEDYGDPKLYMPILEKYKNLRLCLAHLGGQHEWLKYMNDPWYVSDDKNGTSSWLVDIIDLLPKFTNLYTDISYTIFYFQEFVPALKVFLTDPIVRDRVLFGSDYYMADLEAENERLLSINLRVALGEDLFWQIANKYPEAFLRLHINSCS